MTYSRTSAMIAAVPSVTAMAPYALAGAAPLGVVSLAQNESAFPASPAAVAAGLAALVEANLYPDPDWADLRAAIAATHGLDPDAILCGAGSMELIGCLIRAFAGPGDEVLAPAYGYLFVATATQQAGAAYVTAHEPAMTVCVEALLAAVTPRTAIVFVCNPGNPTGTCIANDEILRLREGLPKRVLLVVDQAYGEFDAQDPAPIFALPHRSGTCVLRTFSKAYGLAGARVGWGLFPAVVAIELRKLLNPNNVPAVSQAMTAAAMRDDAYMRAVVARTAAIRDRFAGRLRDAGFAPPKSRSNFVLIPFAGSEAADSADRRLRAEGLSLRRMTGYGLSHCLRATIASAETMDRAADIIAAHGPGEVR